MSQEEKDVTIDMAIDDIIGRIARLEHELLAYQDRVRQALEQALS